ncbi:3-hydroxyacyl-CoA dehydrogenase family protein [Tissierella praeacuta]|uniref:3-hydroxyacyl-CoA dehydrogenase family protein n=1 Tax=Tissierella praeacuta TaxID=43131 RepID=UPI002FD8FD3A
MNLENIKKIGIAGAGTMGSGIAQIFARKGYEVVVTDVKEEFLENSKRLVSIFNKSLIEEGLMGESEVESTIKNIKYNVDKKIFSDCDIIIEAIIEKIDIKQDFWKEVEKVAKPDAIFATNTSGLSITEISKKLENKGRFIGMHFWNPPHIIPLVELIKGDGTKDEIINILLKLLKKIDKEPVVVQKDVPGFIGNRIQFAVFREALNIVEKGIATFEDVDRAMKYGPGFRYPIIGPLQTADLGD